MRLLGVNPEDGPLWEDLGKKEAIDLFGSYYPNQLPTSEVLEIVSLRDKEKAFVQNLSGGQRLQLLRDGPVIPPCLVRNLFCHLSKTFQVGIGAFQ